MHGRVLAVSLALGLAGAPAPAWATTYVVQGTKDTDGSCDDTACPSIRSALNAADDGDAIVVPAGLHELSGTLDVRHSVTLTGAGAARTVIAANAPEGPFRVFQIVEANTVEIAHLTMAGGDAGQGDGGDLLNHGDLTLDHVRVSGGRAQRGGGVANVGGSLRIQRSLVDGNEAMDEGGGVNSSAGRTAALTIADTTVAFNAAPRGGGVAVTDLSEAGGVAALRGVTVARNVASRGAAGIAIAGRDRGSVSAAGTIVAGNLLAGAHAAALPANCDAQVRPGDGGGDLEDAESCGFATAPADPRLGSELEDAGGETPVLRLGPGSPAVDLAGECSAADQRDVARPQGTACDAGAYELAAPAIVTGPAGVTTDRTPTFTFSAPGGGALECRLDGPGAAVGSWVPCTSPWTAGALADGGYAFSVRAAGGGPPAARAFTVASPPAAPSPTPAPAPTPTPTPARTSQAPPPVYHRTVVVRPTRGVVRIRLPGHKRFVALRGAQSIPLRAIVDVRRGRIRLTAARSRSGATQSATFFAGVFRVTQAGHVTQLALRGPKPRCGASSARVATASARHKKKKHKHRRARTRRLWGDGAGAFRIRGRYSAATVRGTKWVVADTCRSTVTRVVRGAVRVRDFRRHRTILLRAGARYVAHRR